MSRRKRDWVFNQDRIENDTILASCFPSIDFYGFVTSSAVNARSVGGAGSGGGFTCEMRLFCGVRSNMEMFILLYRFMRSLF